MPRPFFYAAPELDSFPTRLYRRQMQKKSLPKSFWLIAGVLILVAGVWGYVHRSTEPEVALVSVPAPAVTLAAPSPSVHDVISVKTDVKVPVPPGDDLEKNPEANADPEMVKQRDQEEKDLHSIQFALNPIEKVEEKK